MSYTVKTSKTIRVSGQVRASYPPSQTGGSHYVSYSEDVLVNMNVMVQTEPFDQSVDGANRNIDGLTASVAAMNAANCAAIVNNSQKISKSLTDGFYGLIQSDLTSKKTEAKSQIQAKSSLLMSHSQAVTDKHNRMLTDVERERAKYSQVFLELDKELERRITEIDRPAFTLARKVRDGIVIKPHVTDAAVTADRFAALCESGKIAVAGLRAKVGAVLGGLSQTLGSNMNYRRTMQNILWKKTSDDTQQEYIPVAYCVSQNISDTGARCSCYVSDSADKQKIAAAVTSFVNARMGAPREIPQEEKKLIGQAFSSMVQDEYNTESHDEYHERVYNEIFRMWKSEFSDIKQV